jgi:hypothetical protein
MKKTLLALALVLSAGLLYAQTADPGAAAVPTSTAKAVQIVALAGVLFGAIQGVKNVFPAAFLAMPKLGLILNAAGSLAAALMTCLNPSLDFQCVFTAVMTFLGAAGIYHTVDAASGNKLSASAPPPKV